MLATKLFSSAPLEQNTHVDDKLERKVNDKNSFKNSNYNLKEMIIHFKY